MVPQALPNNLNLVNTLSSRVIGVVCVKAPEVFNGNELQLMSPIFVCLFCDLLQPVFTTLSLSIFPCSTNTESYLRHPSLYIFVQSYYYGRIMSFPEDSVVGLRKVEAIG